MHVPEAHAEKLRQALWAVGAGRCGDKYDCCAFSTKGTGYFRPLKGANPAIGQVGVVEQVAEESVEFSVTADVVHGVIQAMKDAHPYEEIYYELFELVDVNRL